MPVSVTSIVKTISGFFILFESELDRFNLSLWFILIFIYPCSENLSALLTKFNIICLIRETSINNIGGRS